MPKNAHKHVRVVPNKDGHIDVQLKNGGQVIGTFPNMSFVELFVESVEQLCKDVPPESDHATRAA
jgi:hypothetical protein